MSDTVIRVENLGKKYIIGHQKQERYLTLRDAIAQTARSFGQHFLPSNHKDKSRLDQEEFWALKDVSFEIKQGDRVGIIGRNGAGKSTLLKILSRITEPTTGRISIKGRVASLLEVGTGFHPELTGRENIYLNGAILGMGKTEISRKFDEIVAFAEVEKFLDTPVKRYSSGMYVRLAFAVAAHLEPEVLVVDEVLAVGDSKFQKKCLGRMKDISTEGRTIIFVSHQMGTIAQLCNYAFLMERGKITKKGNSKEIINSYIENLDTKENQFCLKNEAKTEFCILEAKTVNKYDADASEFSHTESIALKLRLFAEKWINDLVLGVSVKDLQGRKIFTSQIGLNSFRELGKQELIVNMKVPAELLVPGQYFFSIALHVPNIQILEQLEEICKFIVVDMGSEFAMYEGVDYGCIFANCSWEVSPAQV